MAVFQGGCLECERLHKVWSPIRDRLSETLHKAQAVESMVQSESETRLKKLEERLWKEAWVEYKVVLAKMPKAKRLSSNQAGSVAK